MIGGRWTAWVMLAIWGAWLSGLRAWLAPLFGAWTPDPTVALLVAAVLTFPRSTALGVTLVLALTRVAHTLDAPVAVLAGFGLCLQLSRATHRTFDHALPWARAAASGACAWALGSWLTLVRGARASASEAAALAASFPTGGERAELLASLQGGPGLAAQLGHAVVAGLPGALTTALLAFGLGPTLASLPGLSPLRKRWL